MNSKYKQIVNKIINRTNIHNVSITKEIKTKTKVQLTGSRIQSILYLCKLLWLADYDTCEMIPEDFEIWPTGPIIKELYDKGEDINPFPVTARLTEEERETINKVVDNTINKSTESIIEFITREGSLWNQLYDDGKGLYRKISERVIHGYMQDENNQKAIIEFIEYKEDGKVYGKRVV